MNDRKEPNLPKWPFYLGDALLLGAAYLIYSRSSLPLGHWSGVLIALCVGAGVVVCAAPFVLEYRARIRLAEADGLATVVGEVRKMESIADQISGATGRWQEAQEAADRTAAAAREIGDRMTSEVKAFMDFLQRANDSEKATLRLEADKLRRGEAEWLQLVVHLLDHVYALHQGALRSGQVKVIEQVGHLQVACREAARRVGLTPFIAETAEPFDAQRHQAVENGAPLPADAKVSETLATGYTFQGRLVRPALVRLNSGTPAGDAAATQTEPAADGAQSQLPLDRAGEQLG
ncbi:MAG TPA: nucleotide exchange factor GrpE [Candidatus Acidoferrum sp.]|nr:nucleotide exchange factor GrpE [Candidatus Acidoferrum sp.]